MIIPFNPTTNKPYTGKNIDKLLETASQNNFLSYQFATFKQWLNVGRIVKKGQKAAAKIFYVSDNEGERKGRAFAVFSLEQTQILDEGE